MFTTVAVGSAMHIRSVLFQGKLHEVYGWFLCLSQSSMQRMRKNYIGFVWEYRTKVIEPHEDMVVCLEPENSFADIIGSEEVTSHN